MATLMLFRVRHGAFEARVARYQLGHGADAVAGDLRKVTQKNPQQPTLGLLGMTNVEDACLARLVEIPLQHQRLPLRVARQIIVQCRGVIQSPHAKPAPAKIRLGHDRKHQPGGVHG